MEQMEVIRKVNKLAPALSPIEKKFREIRD